MPPYTKPKSKKQAGFLGAELARKEKGQKGKTDMSVKELKGKMKGTKKKSLPEKAIAQMSRKEVREKIQEMMREGK